MLSASYRSSGLAFLFAVIVSCYSSLAFAGPLTPLNAPNVTSNNVDLGPHQLYQELHIVSNGSSSAGGGAPTVQCNNGYMLTQPVYLSGTSWFYTCMVLLSPAYDLKHAPYTSESSGAGGFSSNWGWAAVPNSNYNETASLVCMNGTCPKTTFTTPACMGMGSHFKGVSGYDVNGYNDVFNEVTTTIYDSSNAQLGTAFSYWPTDPTCGETNSTLSVSVSPGQTITVKKVSVMVTGGTSKTLTCIASYVVLPTDVGNQLWMDCCINNNTTLTNANYNNVTIGPGNTYTASIITKVNNAGPCASSPNY